MLFIKIDDNTPVKKVFASKRSKNIDTKRVQSSGDIDGLIKKETATRGGRSTAPVTQ